MPPKASSKGGQDVFIRIIAVGIFVIENINHSLNFESEVNSLVAPALAPIPIFLAYVVHGITVVLGILGSITV